MFIKLLKKMGFNLEESSWILYDVANSAQTLTTMTVLFPLLIGFIAPENEGSIWVGWANTIYALILAILSPILGTIADYKDKKMKFFKFFLGMGVIGGFLLALPIFDYKMCVFIYVFAMMGYTAANIFYDAFLVDVTTDDRMHKVSSAGYAWGYIGSALPFCIFIIPFAIVTFFGDVQIGGFTLTYRLAIMISMLSAVIWWAYHSRHIIKNVKQTHYHEEESHFIRKSFKRLVESFKNIKSNRNIFLFCLAYFFYIDAVNTVITMAVALVSDMGVSDVVSLLVVIFINVIACPGAIIFGKLTDKFGGKPMLFSAILGYFVVVLVGSQIARNVNLIWALGFLVGCFQGGIQAVSRSYYALLIPDKSDSNEYFGFFEIFSKFSAILGPFIITIVVTITQRAELGILGLIPSLVIGAILLAFVKNPTTQVKK